jgi:hypothetical protein
VRSVEMFVPFISWHGMIFNKMRFCSDRGWINRAGKCRNWWQWNQQKKWN